MPEQERPGLFPDPLFEKKINPPRRKLEPLSSLTETGEKTIPHAARDCFKALWITVNESGRKIPAGEHTVRVRFLSRRDGELVGEACVSLRVEDACLPRNDFLYINWVHCDCLSDLYGVPLFSDHFFDIYAAYIRMAAAHGMNTLLTPCFTPPLDTPIGEYRMPVQLVGVVQHGKKYEFDFTLLRRFLHLALDCGITHFEHSHLFSQWGAECAPAVYATVRGKTKRIFGWDTPVSRT